MGVELAKPILSERCRELNFTNEGGANGSVRLLKNISGLWPFQQCRLAWQRAGSKYEWSELTSMASKSKPLQSLIDLDHPRFVAPNNMGRCHFGILQVHQTEYPDRRRCDRPRDPRKPSIAIPILLGVARGTVGIPTGNDPHCWWRRAERAALPNDCRCLPAARVSRAGRSDRPWKHRRSVGLHRSVFFDCRRPTLDAFPK
jgi:hypothetical protein